MSGEQRHARKALPWWPQAHGCVALLPYTKVVRKRTKLPPPVTIGEHIKQARLAKGLFQVQAAELMGVTEATVVHWEKGQTEPQMWAWPAVVNFLGYDPTPAPTNLPERMRAYRRRHGLSIRAVADRLGVDEGTWIKWEQTGTVAWERYSERLEAFLDDCTGMT